MSEEKQYIVFQLEKEEYAIDIMKIHEINRLKELTITEVPHTPEFVKGIINLRGEIVSVIDLRRKFGFVTRDPDKKSRILIVKIGTKMVGMIVDGVSEVVDLKEDNISLPPEEIKSIHSRFISGVAKVGYRLIILLDIEQILSAGDKQFI